MFGVAGSEWCWAGHDRCLAGRGQVVRSLFYIFQALNLGAVPYLPKVRSMLSGTLLAFLVQQLSTAAALLPASRQHCQACDTRCLAGMVMPMLFAVLRSVDGPLRKFLVQQLPAGRRCCLHTPGTARRVTRCFAQVMPVLFAVLRSADDALREFLVQQLTALVALLRAHMRKWLPDTLALAAELWSQASPQPQLLPHLLKLISELAGAHPLPRSLDCHLGPVVVRGFAIRPGCVALTLCAITPSLLHRAIAISMTHHVCCCLPHLCLLTHRCRTGVPNSLIVRLHILWEA